MKFTIDHQVFDTASLIRVEDLDSNILGIYVTTDYARVFVIAFRGLGPAAIYSVSGDHLRALARKNHHPALVEAAAKDETR
jgi:hypothetical protein